MTILMLGSHDFALRIKFVVHAGLGGDAQSVRLVSNAASLPPIPLANQQRIVVLPQKSIMMKRYY